MDTVREERQSLWLLTFPPAIWMAHFLASYVIVSIYCGRFSAQGGLGPAPLIVIGLGIASLAGIAAVGRTGWRKHTYGADRVDPPHGADTPEDRHRFLGFATVLLAALSAVATLYVTVVALFFGTCR